MTADVPSWLVQEVSDLLDASSVGLYEFIWLLRAAYPNASEEELRAWAADALRRLLKDSRRRLVLQEWPSEDAIGDVPQGMSPADDDWNDPAPERPYVAITRN
jgi:hypothetical protein